MTSQLLAAAPGFEAPGPLDFFLPNFFDKSYTEYGDSPASLLTKPAALLLISLLLVSFFLLSSSRRRAVVPSRWQYMGEQAYELVRNSVGRDVIGANFMKWVPLLVSLFFFVIVNNLFSIVPFLQFPTFSRVNYAYGLAAMVWIIYNAVGIADKGFFGYLKFVTVPSGVPWALYPLIVPLEFLSNIIVRPITLSLRLFANMFAGHLLIILFSSGGAYLLIDATGPIVKPAGVVAFAMGIAIGFLEVVVASLQAYVFTLLTASYIAGAQSQEH